MNLMSTQLQEFKTQAYKDSKFLEVSHEDVLGEWVIFFFYSADFSFVYPTELSDLAEHYRELQKLGVEVFSISTDTYFVHKAWHDTSEAIGKIQYYMLADPSGRIPTNFQCLRSGQGLADRTTFLLDPQGIIQFLECASEGVGRNTEELVRKVKAAQYIAAHPGEVRSTKWEEGADTLAPFLDLVGKI